MLQLPQPYRSEIEMLLVKARVQSDQVNVILQDLDALFVHQLITACVENLAPEERSIYESRVLAGAPPQELARLLKLNLQTLSRLMIRLADALKTDIAKKYPLISP